MNDLGVNYTINGLDDFIEFGKKDFGVELTVTPQEPFMATPCISSKVCEHDRVVMLDKIRAEIAELWHYYPMGHDYEIAINRCIAVIDKYKAESEPQESE